MAKHSPRPADSAPAPIVMERYGSASVSGRHAKARPKGEPEVLNHETEVAKLLGLARGSGKARETRITLTPLYLADRVRAGLPLEAVLALRVAFQVTDREFAALLGLSPRTLARMRIARNAKVHHETQRHDKRAAAGVAVWRIDVPATSGIEHELLLASHAASDRAYRLANLLAHARGLFGTEDALRWLKAPQRGLGGRVPLELAVTEVGSREVETLLGRIAHGVYS